MYNINTGRRHLEEKDETTVLPEQVLHLRIPPHNTRHFELWGDSYRSFFSTGPPLAKILGFGYKTLRNRVFRVHFDAGILKNYRQRRANIARRHHNTI